MQSTASGGLVGGCLGPSRPAQPGVGGVWSWLQGLNSASRAGRTRFGTPRAHFVAPKGISGLCFPVSKTGPALQQRLPGTYSSCVTLSKVLYLCASVFSSLKCG